MKEEKGIVYPIYKVGFATYLGGPLIAGYLISQNYKIFGDNKAAKKSLIVGILATIVVFVVVLLLPESISNKIPSSLIPISYTSVAIVFVQSYQNKKIEEYLKNGYAKASLWRSLRLALLSLIITLAIFVPLHLIFHDINVKYNYAGYLKNYCNSSYTEKSISKDKVYVPEDASCFVFQRLKEKGFTLRQVDQVLTLEFDYQKKIGLVDNSEKDTIKSQYDPLPYVKKHQTLGLGDDQINRIFDEELEYMKFVGIEVTESK